MNFMNLRTSVTVRKEPVHLNARLAQRIVALPANVLLHENDNFKWCMKGRVCLSIIVLGQAFSSIGMCLKGCATDWRMIKHV